jgi:cellulose synthase/poly-beta-1,6-N-acetylglucosamine synthase-like glycosyltransferase
MPLIIFGMGLIIQLFYYWFFYARTAFGRMVNPAAGNLPPVSVVISAKNEAENLKEFLPSILEQDYPDFEVVVVNDASSDDTEMVLGELKAKYPRLKVTFLSEDKKFSHGKKLALTIGIKAAKNELLLFTDADCYAPHKSWIRSMVQNYDGSTDVVLGYGGYTREKSLLNNIIRFDTFFIGMQYLGFARAGIPYMGVGRNLSYRKSIFFRHKGFAGHSFLRSGDDDLFVNEVATRKNTKVEYAISSHTRSIPEKSWKKWANQKNRHFTTSRYYRGGHKFLLFLEPFSRLLMYGGVIWTMVINLYIYHVLIALLIRILSQMFVIKYSMQRLNEKNLLLTSLIYDIFLPFIYLVFRISKIFGRKKNRWM